ncbi:MAG: redoxin domain-containing protein [Gemmatimonadaceae bacterium]|nr:redoxin domain-containing protein [Gemmatimonadaceae bacterium]
MPSRIAVLTVVAVALVGFSASRVWAQGEGPQVGDLAPDFSLPGASKAGVTEKALRLSDFRGQTVVISFFPKARTKG